MQKLLTILLLTLLGGPLFGQTDSIPRIFEEKFDWLKFKAAMNAPTFNQKDIVMYMVRQEGLAELFGDNPDQNWVYGFHFLDLDKNQYLDAVFSGEVTSKESPYTMLFMGDTTLSFPQAFAQRGYVNDFKVQKKGISFTFRRNAREGQEFWSECGAWWHDFEQDSTWANWRVWFVGNTAPMAANRVRAFVLDAPTELRWSPEADDKTGYDWDGDNKADALGNIVGIFRKGAQLLQTYEQVDEDGERWSYVILLDGVQELRAYPPETEIGPGPSGVYMAGWLPTKALGRR